MENKPTIYTIGHARYNMFFFIELLKENDINCIVDVRSVPETTYAPRFNKDNIRRELAKEDISYLHFGKEFGERHDEPELLDTDRNVDFQKVIASDDFKKGVERIKNGVQKGFVIALMGSQYDPLVCHRFLMVSLGLVKEGFDIRHFTVDADVITNDHLEYQLLKKYDDRLPKPEVLHQMVTLEEQLSVAYRLANKEIAYHSFEKKEYSCDELFLPYKNNK